MLFGTPTKLQDGRYFLKITTDMTMVKNVTMSLSDNQATLSIPDSSMFTDIDEKILTQAKVSKTEWFGKEISDDTVVSAYQKSLNLENELSASLATIKGQIVTTVYGDDKKSVDISSVDSTTKIDVFVHLTGLVFTKRSFEPVWKLIQVRIKGQPKSRFPREYLFTDDDPEEEDMDL